MFEGSNISADAEYAAKMTATLEALTDKVAN
jgi:hypothetical protein